MPANNVHAVISGTRTSPVDGLNFNRTFPGDAQGSITQQISDFVAHEIFPRGDAFLDLHSGGSSLDILPSTVIEPTNDPALHDRNVQAARAFDAPMNVVISNHGDKRTATAAACAAGLVTVGTEMGGAGTVRPDILRLCRRGVRNVLVHLGVLPADTSTTAAARMSPCSNSPAPALSSTRRPTASSSPIIPMDNRCMPARRPGVSIAPGSRHASPEILYYQADGILYGRRQPGRVRPGNCCLVVAAPYSGSL